MIAHNTHKSALTLTSFSATTKQRDVLTVKAIKLILTSTTSIMTGQNVEEKHVVNNENACVIKKCKGTISIKMFA